jgi:hypothetical protein
MSSAPQLGNRMTAAEYLEWEWQQTERHEFVNGEVFLQAGGTRRHSLIGANLLRDLGTHLKAGDCEAHGSDMRIHVEVTGMYAYPVVFVVCPPVEGESDDGISNPVLLAEVLSPSTADYDRGGKFLLYASTLSSGSPKRGSNTINVPTKVIGFCMTSQAWTPPWNSPASTCSCRSPKSTTKWLLISRRAMFYGTTAASPSTIITVASGSLIVVTNR